MSSEKQVTANHANSLKSTGPKSAAGRRRASLNATKHGLRSRRKDALVASGYAYAERRRKWLAQHDAQTDYDEFMIASSVSLVCDVERARRVQAADQFSENEISDEKAAEQAEELGGLLFFDPGGPAVSMGMTRFSWTRSRLPSAERRMTRTSPGSLCALESTSAGCEFLLREWNRLKNRAKKGFWLSPDRFRAVRMLKHQPVDAIENWTVAMIFVASHGILRLGKTGFEDLRADMPEPALDGFVRKLKARFSELCIEWTVDQCREMLIDLANGEIKRLKSKSARHVKRAERDAEQAADKLGEDSSPKGVSLKQLELKCLNTIKRLMAPYQTERKDKPKGGGKRAAGCPDEGRKVRDESWGERGERRGRDGRSVGEGEETCGRGDGGVGDPRRTCGGGGGVGEETCGRGDGGVGDPRRT